MGVMLDFWTEETATGAAQEIKVYVFNDTYDDWDGDVRLVLLQGTESKLLEAASVKVEPLGSRDSLVQVHRSGIAW